MNDKESRSDTSKAHLPVRIKIIRHLKGQTAKKVDPQMIQGIEVISIAENAPVISQTDGKLKVSSRPERADVVVRMLQTDPRLDPEVDERNVKRWAIGNVVFESIVVGHPSA